MVTLTLTRAQAPAACGVPSGVRRGRPWPALARPEGRAAGRAAAGRRAAAPDDAAREAGVAQAGRVVADAHLRAQRLHGIDRERGRGAGQAARGHALRVAQLRRAAGGVRPRQRRHQVLAHRVVHLAPRSAELAQSILERSQTYHGRVRRAGGRPGSRRVRRHPAGRAHRPRKHAAPARAPHRELDGGLRHDLDDRRQVAAPEPEQAAGRPHLAQRGRQPRVGRVGHHHGAQALQHAVTVRLTAPARPPARKRASGSDGGTCAHLRAHESRTRAVAACLRDARRRHDRACPTTLAPRPCTSARGRQCVGHGAHLRGAPWSRDGTMTRPC